MQLSVTLSHPADVNTGQFFGNQDESAIAINPSTPQQMFVYSNHTNGPDRNIDDEIN